MRFISINNIIKSLYRNIKDTPLNEGDIIEWIGEALGFMHIPYTQEKVVEFKDVQNYETTLPNFYSEIIQIAKVNNYEKKEKCEEEIKEKENIKPNYDCKCGDIVYGLQPLPYTNFKYEDIIKSKNLELIDISFHTFFKKHNEIKNNNILKEDVYECVIIEDKIIRFSFKEGVVLLAYYSIKIDKETGFPMIIDESNHKNALIYYVKWKIAEWWLWNGRANANLLARESERLWETYLGRANAYAKMPKNVYDYEHIKKIQKSLNKNNFINYFKNL